MLEKIFIGLINIYQQYIRPRLPSSCRFIPSCSEYARQAIIKYGFGKGILKAVKRIVLCHPFSGRSGYDPLE
ncbi:MAG: membrane protein insertion efficiency factor YidD [Candidatus Omnitrophica bacterium]|nr:membrane protein insertion efficiency factor YidD [Candidatus Omnitrophota bacterium]MBU4473392.1 membrane protein insertion efficiency factor YidD [Candidatus Omnitrophota bacterium]MCG2706483.1 membrane protein insertion efficiency factor YidD [Candidatus Omnitrophota bacterium]